MLYSKLIKLFWIDAVLVVKDIIVIYRKNETILVLISLKRYFSHPEKSILKSSSTLRRLFNSGPGITMPP